MPRQVRNITSHCAFLIAGLAILSGCQGDPRKSRIEAEEAAINVGSSPRSLDPSLVTDIPSTLAMMPFTRGLTVLDDEGKPQPELAESWTVSSDGLTYTFKLRLARWTSGEPVTADDFVYAWTRRMLNPAFAAEYAYQLFYLKGAREYYTLAGEQLKAKGPMPDPASIGVRALAPDRLEATLASPTPFFLTLVAHSSYYPVSRKVDQANPHWAERAETYVGCGPFLMREYRPGDVIVGEKNPDYWNAANVKLKRLTLRMIERAETERIAFENGEIDGTQTVPRTDIPALRGRPELRFSPQYSTYFLFLNCRHKPLDDPRVRRALALAIDRKAIVTRITNADEKPALNLAPPALYKQPPAPAFGDAQFDEARRLLAEAGFPGGQGFPKLRYIYNTLETHQQIAQALQETWRRELGITVSIENQEFKVLIDNRRHGNFDIARAGWTADFVDPINFLEILDSQSDNNDSHWADPRYDQLLATSRAEGRDLARREDLLRQTEAYLMAQMPVAPIYFATSPYQATPKLKGYVLNPMGMFDAARLSW